MIKTSIETRVGILFFLTIVTLGIFVYLLGIFNPFTPTYKINVIYNYAGGLAVGSPVRVAGVKVGRVSDIKFITTSDTQELKISVTLLIRTSVKHSLKQDSSFYINMSGLIGEKYIEIKPGSSAEIITPGFTTIGIDPPRIDEFISQSYDLFSKIEKIMVDNKGNFTRVLTIVENLTHALNDIFKSTKKTDSDNIRNIISNIRRITSDFQEITKNTKTSIIPILQNLKPTIDHVKEASKNIKIFSSFLSSLNQKDKKHFENAVKNLFLITKSLDKLTIRLESSLKELPDLNLEEFKTIFSQTGVKVKLF